MYLSCYIHYIPSNITFNKNGYKNIISLRINLWLSWLGGQWYPQPTRVQILVLALFLDLFQDFRRCAFSGRRRSRRRRGAYGDFVNLKMICRLSLSEVLIGVGCACVRS